MPREKNIGEVAAAPRASSDLSYGLTELFLPNVSLAAQTNIELWLVTREGFEVST